MSDSLVIAGRTFGARGRCLVIAEVALAHEGSLGMAHAFIDAAASTGADAVKFQTHIAEAESTPSEPFRVRFSTQDASRYDYWRRTAFTPAQWEELRGHAEKVGLLFLSSPFSLEALTLLDEVGVPAWKIPSGEITNIALLEAAARTGKPVLLSSGMSTWAELDAAVAAVRSQGGTVLVMQCTSEYPCPPEKVGLNVLREMAERYHAPVGLSDHSGTTFASLAAATLGASAVEVHFTFSKRMFGPDVPASITVEQLSELVAGIRFVERARASRVQKDDAAAVAAPMKRLFQKSVVVRHDLRAGHVLASADLAAKKPGTGIPASRAPEVVGRRLKRDVRRDDLLTEEMLE